jgi:phenylacetate-CoA ligase
LSTSMQMTQGLRESLSQRFACPVLDIYSMNEAGPIAVFDPQRGGYILLQPWLWLEILGADDLPVAAGEMGEITLTGGFNPWLPLRRYRTGDFARLQVIDGLATLLDLSGRPPVRFKTMDGRWVNNVDLSQALQPFLLVQYTIHQNAEGAIEFQCVGIAPEAMIDNTLRQILGDWPIRIDSHVALPDKVIQYTSAYIE